jgi:hypothetical protein
VGVKLSRRKPLFVRSRAAAGLVLLVLMAHALVASTTHFHRLANAGAESTRNAFVSRDGDGRNVPPAGDDAQCLLCRLQRNFISGIRHAAPALAPLQVEALDYEPLRNVSARAARALLRHGRAPPLV